MKSISARSPASAGATVASAATARLAASRAKPNGTPFCCIEVVPLDKGDGAHRRHHHLGDAVAAPDLENLVAEVDQDHLDLAAIVGVHRARRIEHRHAVLGGE